MRIFTLGSLTVIFGKRQLLPAPTCTPRECTFPTRYVDDETFGPLALCTHHFIEYFDSHYTREISKEVYSARKEQK